VPEVEAVLYRLIGADQLLAYERRKQPARRPPAVRRKPGECFPLEVESDHRRALQQLALVGRKRVETGGQERLDRRRNRVGRPSFGQRRDELLDEQRIAFGNSSDPDERLLVEP
jgi:hypothetical protein